MGKQFKTVKNEFMLNNDPQKEAMERLSQIAKSEFGQKYLTLD